MKKIWLILILSFTCNLGCAEEVSYSESVSKINEMLTDKDSLEDSAGIMTWVDVPRTASIGDEINLRVSVKNTRESRVFEIDTLDIGRSFLDAFEIVSIEPKPKDIDTDSDLSALEYALTIKAGEELDFVLKIKATTAGNFIGDIDVWGTDSSFLTRYVQSQISE